MFTSSLRELTVLKLIAVLAFVALLPTACVVGGKGADLAGTAAGSASKVTAAAIAPVPSPFGSYLAGRHAEVNYDLGAAADFMAGALDRDPANPELLERTYRLMAGEGRMRETAELARRVLELNPDAPLSGVTLVVEAVEAGDYKAARKRLSALPRTGLDQTIVPLLEAWVLFANDELDSALDVLEPEDEDSSFAPLYDLHAALINDLAGRPEEAERRYRNVLEGAARIPFRMIETVASFYQRTGRPEEAGALYADFEEENPGSVLVQLALERFDAGLVPEPVVGTAKDGLAEVLFNLASVLNREDATQMALIFARMALYLRPDFDIVRMLLAEVLERQGRYEAAIAAYGRVGTDSPFHWFARLRLASNLIAVERTEEAIERLNAMAGARPDRPDVLINLGDVLRGMERFAEAVEAYDRAIERIPELERRHWGLLYARGIALERSKQWPRAEADFLRALEFEPDQPLVLNYLGYSWVELGVNMKRAQEMIERAVELRPNDGYIIDSLGWVLYRTGHYRQAVAHLERAVELRPEDATINDHLGDAYWKVGRLNEARFQWQRALSLEPDAELAASIEAKLARGLDVEVRAEGGS